MRRVWTAAATAALAIAIVAVARAEDGGSARPGVDGAPIGEPFTIVVELETPSGRTVEIDPTSPSWNGVDVLEVVSADVVEDGGVAAHRLELRAAAFLPGELQVAPAVLVFGGATVERRELPAFSFAVPWTIGDDTPLVLLGEPEPLSIAGGPSPLLAPAIGFAAVSVGGLVLALSWLVLRKLVRRRRQRKPLDQPEKAPTEHPLPAPQQVLDDPVPAYRSMAAVVRSAIGEHYGFPARSLTTNELVSRMQREGVDRWQARLVEGLLQNCDSVVYAGYRPASDRRRADLTMAEEILEGLG
jgi:hypothetical protein